MNLPDILRSIDFTFEFYTLGFQISMYVDWISKKIQNIPFVLNDTNHKKKATNRNRIPQIKTTQVNNSKKIYIKKYK